MRRSILAVITLYFWIASTVNAQNYPAQNSVYVNPFLYNPAEAASDYTVLYINHRRQWENTHGAPIVTTVNLHSLLNYTRSGFGFKASSFSRGIFETTDVSMTYAYGIPTTKTSTLFFGVSGGVVSDAVDVYSADPGDPVMASGFKSKVRPGASLGFVYKTAKGFNLGATLPQLFEPGYSDANPQVSSFSPVDNVILSAYYKRKLERKTINRRRSGIRRNARKADCYAPVELYTWYKYNAHATGQFEGLIKLNVTQSFWLGGGYRQPSGAWATGGVSFKSFVLAYSYEPNHKENSTSSVIHEVQLGLRFGQARHFRRETPVLRSTLKAAKSEAHTARFENVEGDSDVTNDEVKQNRKYLVVVKSLNDFNAADAFKKKLMDQKFNANIFYYSKDRKYHVYVLETKKASEGHEEVRNLKNYSKLTGARLLGVIANE